MKKVKGITLISLVITVILLLILATVAIELAVDSDGIFKKAGEAANKWNASIAEEEAIVNEIIEEMNSYLPLNWEKLLADVETNPQKYRHPQQRLENEDIGIGTDGKPVNMDWWTYTDESLLEGEMEGYELSIFYESGYTPGYIDDNIENGKIKGTVPAYIMEKDGELKPVISMAGTFNGCTKLEIAPVIPKTVTNIGYAFQGCTNLKTAPIIHENIINMWQTFFECQNLTGIIKINANPTDYDNW